MHPGPSRGRRSRCAPSTTRTARTARIRSAASPADRVRALCRRVGSRGSTRPDNCFARRATVCFRAPPFCPRAVRLAEVAGDDPSWVSVALEEYRSLRQESLQAIDRQHQVLALGTATSGVVLGVAAKESSGSTAATILLVVLLPLLVSLIVVLWLGEFRRMARAGAHIAEVERVVSSRYAPDPPPLSWETVLRDASAPRGRIAPLYRAIFAAAVSIGLAGAGLGMVGLADKHHWAWFGILLAFDIALFVSTFRLYICTEVAMRQIGGEDVEGARFWRTARWLHCAPSTSKRMS
jgi:hypothetical protein